MRVCKHGCDVLDSCVFFRIISVYIASSKHSEGWENATQLCKPETLSRVCITSCLEEAHGVPQLPC